MLDYRDISLMESVHLMWGPVTASPVGIEPMTILEGGAYNWYPIHNGENSTFGPAWPPNTPYACAEARRTQVADATFRDLHLLTWRLINISPTQQLTIWWFKTKTIWSSFLSTACLGALGTIQEMPPLKHPTSGKHMVIYNGKSYSNGWFGGPPF